MSEDPLSIEENFSVSEAAPNSMWREVGREGVSVNVFRTQRGLLNIGILLGFREQNTTFLLY